MGCSCNMLIGLHQWIVISLATGALALIGLLMSFTTTHWVYMEESCSHNYEIGDNQTQILNFTMYSNAGLWRICSHTGDVNDKSCTETGLNYGLDKSKDGDKQWTTGTVVEATRVQFPLTCLAVVLTLSGFICSIVGNYKRDKKTIIAAVLYISSGLCLSVSVILFISRINDELGLQKSSKDCEDFRYSYGWSFYLIGIAFVVEETSAVISVKLYLMNCSQSLEDIVRIIPGLENKLFIDKTSLKHSDSNVQTMIW